jgi:hypothetical protein
MLREHFRLIDDSFREEDIASTKAQLNLAPAQLAQNHAIYEKTFLRDPFDETNLRKHHRIGESTTNSSGTAYPVITMGDVSTLRSRVLAECDQGSGSVLKEFAAAER